MPRGVKTTTDNKIEVEAEKDNDMLAKLIEQMNQMQAQIEKLNKEKTSAEELVKELKKNNHQEDDNEELKVDDDIPVISQCVGTLSLSTDGKGGGR